MNHASEAAALAHRARVLARGMSKTEERAKYGPVLLGLADIADPPKKARPARKRAEPKPIENEETAVEGDDA